MLQMQSHTIQRILNLLSQRLSAGYLHDLLCTPVDRVQPQLKRQNGVGRKSHLHAWSCIRGLGHLGGHLLDNHNIPGVRKGLKEKE